MLLDAYEAAIGPTGPNPLHHRSTTLQVSDEQLARMVAMDLATVIHLDGGGGDWVLMVEVPGQRQPENWRVGPAGWAAGATSSTRAARRLGDRHALVPPDSKLTDDIGRPVDQVAGGMDGRGRSNPETPTWMLDQLLTAEQGLRAVTLDAAWALGDEARRGHLAPGTLGDVTILSGDVTAGTPDEIRAITVVATIVGGLPAWCADPEGCSRFGG